MLIELNDTSSLPAGFEKRELWEIVRACFLTIFACTWIAVHPNVPGQKDTTFTILRRRFALMLYCIVAPEVVMVWAMRQWYCARRIAHEFSGQGWTQSHGFLVEMGGFMLCDDQGKELGILTIDRMRHLNRTGRIHWPNISAKQIHDKSKADWLSKGVVIFQTTWFIGQIIARATQGLTITELEVVTLGYATLNGVMYFLWWHKPTNVECTVAVPLIAPGTESVFSEELVYPGLFSAPFFQTATNELPPQIAGREGIMGVPSELSSAHIEVTVLGQATATNDLESDGNTPKGSRTVDLECEPASTGHTRTWNGSWLSNKVSAILDRLSSGLLVVHGSALCPLIGSVTRTSASPEEKVEDMDGARMAPMFHVSQLTGKDDAIRISLANSTLATIFGAVHCIAWNFVFPTRVEQILWKVGSITITCIPTILFSVVAVAWNSRRNPVDCGSTAYILLRMLGNTWVFLYLVARVLLLVQAFVLLRSLSPDAFVSIEWTSFIPHL
ncbi:hypothetical protein FA15DRAFT_680232 [Coprinopsis marcescibilis]|uniref:Uncharacterized protein n=1 Tax=Coprinopsis marcescibilis TaxID=230819 RepID=A0A5C3LAZ9_COPMA|nr:hypothetical protein FA15DRAFT_680232 [Coprinopsis marcescibilis]